MNRSNVVLRSMNTVAAVGTAVLVCGLFAGCGGSGYECRGRLLKGGQPLTVSDKGVIQMVLIRSSEPTTDPIPVDCKTDGTFVIRGKENNGVPPGTYRVSVKALDPYPTTDVLQDQFSPANTKLTVEVTSSNAKSLDIDLDKK